MRAAPCGRCNVGTAWIPPDFEKRTAFTFPEKHRELLLARLGDTEGTRRLIESAERAVSRYYANEALDQYEPKHNDLLDQAARIGKAAEALAELVEGAEPDLWTLARQTWALDLLARGARSLPPCPDYLDPTRLSEALRDLAHVLAWRLPMDFPREARGVKPDGRIIVAHLARAYYEATGKRPGRSRAGPFAALVVVTFDAMGRLQEPLDPGFGIKDELEHRADGVFPTIKAGVALWEKMREPGGG